MKGLILKDFLAIRSSARVYLFLIAFYSFISFSSSNLSLSVLGGVMMSMLPITAIAYDERSNFVHYALTMPVSKTDIVLSKYIFGIILAMLGALISFVSILFIGAGIPLVEKVFTAVAAMCAGLLFQSFILPIVFKFGTEKGRLYMIAMFFLPTVLILLLAKSPFADSINNFAETITLNVVMVAFPIAVIAIYILSVIISLNITKNKVW